MKQNVIITLIALFSLIGCSSGQAERPGPAIDVYPILTSLALQTNPQQQAEAQRALDDFIQAQHSALVTQQVILFSTSEQGERFANQVLSQLRRLGVAENNMHIEKTPLAANQQFDFKIQILSHQVVVPICSAAQISRLGHEGRGCYSESLRWQSMVNPHKMIHTRLSSNDVDVNGE
ncbi:hypothetical protein [Vibrio metschnikovii]|uniref:hypothetical protein n=1 Tax=Vibrio metschnikovii TaxID=28172 RepID=UPI001C2F3B84|nr:hypothetical protein [Vibrio metschnikovii]